MLFLVTLASLYCAQLSSGQILSLNLPNGQINTPVMQNLNPNIQRTINVPGNSIVLQKNGISGINNLNTGISVVNPGISLNTQQLGFNNVVGVSNGIGVNNAVGLNTGVNNLNSLQFANVPVANNVQVVQNLPVTGIVANGIPNNFISTNLANNNLVTANVGGYANNIVSANVGANLNNNWVNANVPINIANGFNINTGTFALGNTGLAQILPNGQPCGIQILADALEVGGSVGVNGQLPFYTTVNVQGSLPTSGSGVVSCGCGSQG